MITKGEPMLLQPNTTTLVDVILNRRQSDRLLVIKDCERVIVVATDDTAETQPTGRAEIVLRERPADQQPVAVTPTTL